MKDEVFMKDRGSNSFIFNREVASVFDDMISRSVPFYNEINDMIVGIVKHFHVPDRMVYDLGCSSGLLLQRLATEMGESASISGVDMSSDMLEQAKQKTVLFPKVVYNQQDITKSLLLPNAGTVILSYTLQFIKPELRKDLIECIFRQLPSNGVLILTEKNKDSCSGINEFFVDEYHQYKAKMGYTALEIENKKKALEGVLVPFSIEQNIEMLREGGASSVSTFFQWYNFSGLLAIK